MVGVPLNIMCSKRCAMPVMPRRSFELPTCATQPPATVGSSCRSTSSSRIPLPRFFSTTGTCCAVTGSAQCKRKTKANNLHPPPVRVPTHQILFRYAMLVRHTLRRTRSTAKSKATPSFCCYYWAECVYSHNLYLMKLFALKARLSVALYLAMLAVGATPAQAASRSEEHTSELQS